MVHLKQKVTGLTLIAYLSLLLVGPIYLIRAQAAPGLVILSPAGALNPNPVVRTSFAVSFTLANFQLVPPGLPNQTNVVNQGHIHIFVNGVYYALWVTENPIQFTGVAPGNHTIKLQLVNNDHSALIPDVSQSINVVVTDAPTGSPSLTILSPAGALNPNANVGTYFKVSFTLANYFLTEPIGQPNALNTGHIHVFLDGNYIELTSLEEAVSFDNISPGSHTIRLQLVKNDHSALSPDVSKSITVNVQAPPGVTVDLTPVTSAISMLYTLSYVVIVLLIIVIILVIVVLARRK